MSHGLYWQWDGNSPHKNKISCHVRVDVWSSLQLWLHALADTDCRGLSHRSIDFSAGFIPEASPLLGVTYKAVGTVTDCTAYYHDSSSASLKQAKMIVKTSRLVAMTVYVLYMIIKYMIYIA